MRESMGLSYVRTWLLDRLRWAIEPVTRDVLAAELSDWARAELGLAWSRETAARRLREAFGELEKRGDAVVSDGTAFRIATTQAERDTAARKMEKTGIACLQRAANIRKLTLGGELRQLGLFGEAV